MGNPTLILNNAVIVRRHTNLETIAGLSVQDFVDPHNHLPVTGEVVAVCGPLTYFPQMPSGGFWSDDEVAIEQERSMLTVERDGPVEVSVGDTVLFAYFYNVQAEQFDYEDYADGLLLIQYNDLLARIDDGGLYPLNGGVFIEPKRKEGKHFVSGVVVSEGCKNFAVRGIDGPPHDGWPPLVGREVFFEPGLAVKIEAELHAKHGNHLPLYHINREWIIAYDQEERQD